MERELTILVIEDDEVACKCFENYAETMENLEIVACTNDSEKGVELVKEYLPDAVILDLELNEGKGSGIDFLTLLEKEELPYKPFVVVTSNNSSKLTVEYVRSLDIGFYVSKHKEDYSEELVLGMLLNMKDIIQGNIRKVDKTYDTRNSEIKREKKLRRKIYNELNIIGISPKMLGYNYLADAIYLVINDQNEQMMRLISEKYKKNPSSVERAMQNAINKAWHTNDIDVLLENYTAVIRSEKGVPTLMEFVYYYAKKIGEK